MALPNRELLQCNAFVHERNAGEWVHQRPRREPGEQLLTPEQAARLDEVVRERPTLVSGVGTDREQEESSDQARPAAEKACQQQRQDEDRHRVGEEDEQVHGLLPLVGAAYVQRLDGDP